MEWPDSLKFTANKILMIVRNPVDALLSFTMLGLTFSHSHAIKENIVEDFPDEFN